MVRKHVKTASTVVAHDLGNTLEQKEGKAITSKFRPRRKESSLYKGLAFLSIVAVCCWLISRHVVKSLHQLKTATKQLRSINRLPLSNDVSVYNPKDCMCLLGDLMVANQALTETETQEARIPSANASFVHLAPIVQECHHVIANLEGPISHLDIQNDPWRRTSPWYSFSMNPHTVPKILKDLLGVTAVNRANNHLLDRGQKGIKETDDHLREVGIASFGKGANEEEILQPFLVETPTHRIAITGFGPRRRANRYAPSNGKIQGTLPVTLSSVTSAKRLLDAMAHDQTKKDSRPLLRLAFVHWGLNYEQKASDDTKEEEQLLIHEGGFDVIVGSDGSHTAQPLEFVQKKKKSTTTSEKDDTSKSPEYVPVLYNVGNFVFSTPGRYAANGIQGFGTITQFRFHPHLHVRLYCTIIDNLIVHYVPRLCTPDESRDLFAALLKSVPYELHESYAEVDLSQVMPSRLLG